MPDNVGTDLLTSAGQMNVTNMLGKLPTQSLSSSGVGLEEDYTKLHPHPPDSPHLRRLTTKIPLLSEKETRVTMTAGRYTLNSAGGGHAPKLGEPSQESTGLHTKIQEAVSRGMGRSYGLAIIRRKFGDILCLNFRGVKENLRFDVVSDIL